VYYQSGQLETKTNNPARSPDLGRGPEIWALGSGGICGMLSAMWAILSQKAVPSKQKKNFYASFTRTFYFLRDFSTSCPSEH